MSTTAACPSCGSERHVTGRPDPVVGDVELTCSRCSRPWWRGGRRCATCGGDALTTRPQVMRRHSRGTQLSIVGWRDARLCERCDADLLASLGPGHTPIPEEYVSAALVDRNAPPASRPPGPGRPAATGVRVPRASLPAAPQEPGASLATHRRTAPARPSPPPPPTTVRVALQEAQTALTAEGTCLDPTVVLLLGTHLGPSTRLDALERSGHDAHSLRGWVEHTWRRGSRGAAARHTLTTLADHWSEQGWTTTDLAAAVRPQEDA